MRPLQPFDPSTATSGSVAGAMLPNGGAFVIYNKSPYELWFSYDSGDVQDIPAWTARLYKTCNRVTAVTWRYAPGWTVPVGQSAPPVSLVSIEVYGPAEAIPETYPIPLTRQVSIPNQVQTNVSSTQSLINDGNAAPTQILEATPQSQGASSWAFNNDASGFLQVLSANVLRKILSVVRGNTGATKAVVTLGDSGDPSILTVYGGVLGGQPATVGALTAATINSDGGKVTTDGVGNLTATSVIKAGALSSDGGRVTTDGAGNMSLSGEQQAGVGYAFGPPTGQAIIAYDTGVHAGYLRSSQVAAQAGGFYFNVWDGSAPHIPFSLGSQIGGAPTYIDTAGNLKTGPGTVRASSFFSGTGGGTYNHGLGATPSFVGITANELNSTQTVGIDTITSTTVHCNMPNAWPFVGVASA